MQSRSHRIRRALCALFALSFALIVPIGALSHVSLAASDTGVTISEFRFRGPSGGNDDFVELLNTNSAAVEISGWQLQGCAASSGSPSLRATVPDGTTLQPGDHYLFANASAYSGTAPGDTTYSTGLSDDGGVRVVESDGAVVDGVGSADGDVDQCREGAGLTLPTVNGDNGFERKSGGTQDTDDNVADFDGPKPSNPQNLGGTIVEPSITKIHEIQGAGSSTPLAGQTVMIEGIVTGWDDEIGANFSRTFPEDAGIFVQEEPADEDGNPNTSEGIFVGFVRDRQAYPIGSVVQLEGQVKEKFGLTMISETINTEPVIVGSAPLPTPTVIDTAAAQAQDPEDRAYYESLENMYVHLEVGVANSGGTNKFGELFLTPGTTQERVFRTDVVPALLATDADAGAGDPDNPFNPEQPSTTLVQGDLFDTVEDVAGPLAFSFGFYKIMVQENLLPTVTDGPIEFPYDELPPATDGQIRVASFNVENYFPAGAELDLAIVSPEEEAEKRTRLAAAIEQSLELPDVVAVQEVADLEILQELAAEIGGYTAYLEPGNDERGIDVGYLIRDTVAASNVRQMGKSEPGPSGVRCSDVDGMLFDRPPLLADITTPGGLTFTVINNHFASKSNPDACRNAQATYVRDLVAEIEAQGGQAIVAGDLNAFEDEEALSILEDGQTTLTNLWPTAPEEERYSFQFSGRLQTLDHILITDGLDAATAGFQYAHFDVNYFERFDQVAPEKVSDHDPPVLTLDDATTATWEYTFTNDEATFYLNPVSQELRFVSDGFDTGVVSDPGMVVRERLIRGRVSTDEFDLHYVVPLVAGPRAVIVARDLESNEVYVLVARAGSAGGR